MAGWDSPDDSHRSRGARRKARGTQPDSSPTATVLRYREVLQRKAALRTVYLRWYEDMSRSLSALQPTVEIGTGHGLMASVMPGVIPTDVFASPFAKLACDATSLPFSDRSVGNFAFVDVLHHIPDPLRAFAEMSRCLKPSGRLVASEPFVSPVSRVAFRLHFERVDFGEELASHE